MSCSSVQSAMKLAVISGQHWLHQAPWRGHQQGKNQWVVKNVGSIAPLKEFYGMLQAFMLPCECGTRSTLRHVAVTRGKLYIACYDLNCTNRNVSERLEKHTYWYLFAIHIPGDPFSSAREQWYDGQICNRATCEWAKLGCILNQVCCKIK